MQLKNIAQPVAQIVNASSDSPKVRSRILCVDDDNVMRRVFQRVLGERFDIHSVSTPREALAFLNQGPSYAVLLSDLNLQGDSGVQLLKAASVLAPDTTRILYSGNVVVGAAMEAVNAAGAFRLIQIPLAEDVLVQAINDAVEHHLTQRRQRAELRGAIAGCSEMMMCVLPLMEPLRHDRARYLAEAASALARAEGEPSPELIELATLIVQLCSDASYTASATARADVAPYAEHTDVALVASLKRFVMSQLPHLPGLERLRHMINVSLDEAIAGESMDPELRRGSTIVQLVREFDALLNQGFSEADAIEALRGSARIYNGGLVSRFETLRKAEQEKTTYLEVRPSDVTVGMSFAEDIRSSEGVLLIARGTRVTNSLHNRLKSEWQLLAGKQTIRMTQVTT